MLRILYCGSPDISARALQDLIDSKKVEIVGVLTNPPSAKGRHKTLTTTPVAQVALNANLTVLEPEKLNEEVRNTIAELNADILVCFAYGKIFGPKFMALFPLGGINLHASLLPKYRGASPVPAAILAGDTVTGNTVQRVAQKMDCGDVLLQKELALTGTENTVEVLETLTGYGADMIVQVLSDIENKTIRVVVQNEEEASYCTTIKKEDGLIDWSASTKDIHAKIRAFYGWPTVFTYLEDSILTIHKASIYDATETEYANSTEKAGSIIGIDKKEGILIKTIDGILAVTNLQKQGKKAMPFKDFLNGMKNLVGMTCTNNQKTT